MFLQDIKLFLEDYAPCKIGSDQVNQCIEPLLALPDPILEMEPTQGSQKSKLAWVPFPIYPDQYTGKDGYEDEVFKPLKKVFDAILQQKDPSNKMHFELCPRTKIDGDLPGGNHLIDGCFMYKDYNPKHLCHRDIDIAVELKKHRTWVDRDESHRQIIGACHHILSEDPRRMWIYGLTIEKNWMTVWYFSRSHSVKTFAFDWFENVNFVIQIVLSFAFATPAELGIDPLVHQGPLSSDGKTCSYVYEVPDSATGGLPRFYKTVQGRIPERRMCITGRITRIWEVVEVETRDGTIEVSAAKCILKDVWLDENTDTEAENMDKIFASVDYFIAAGLEAEIQQELKQNPNLDREPATIDRMMARFINKEKRFKCFNDDTKDRLRGYLTGKKYRSLFLTKRHAWRGTISRALGQDVLHCPTLFTKDPIKRQLLPTSTQKSDQSMTAESHHRDSYQSPDIELLTRQPKESAAKQELLSKRRFVPKQQSRFVYDEVCTRIDRLPFLGDVIDVLSEAVDALHILFLAGWVHRDISVGNILTIPVQSATADRGWEWKVKLSDLEFSRVMVDKDRVPRSDPRTGTPFFMPTEILSRRYLFQDYRLVNPSKGKSRFAHKGVQKAETTENAEESTGSVNLAEQVKKVTRHDYPHLKTFKTMSFSIGGLLEATDLDPAKIPSKSDVVNHNFQHDLESVWWILLWFITLGITNEQPSDWVDALFQHNVDTFHPRFIAFDKPVEQHLLDNLPEDLIESSFPEFMETLRESMHDYYILRPIYGQLDDLESYSAIHALFSECLYDYKRDGGAWRKQGLKYSGTVGLIKLPGSGAAAKRGRSRSGSRAPGSSKRLKND